MSALKLIVLGGFALFLLVVVLSNAAGRHADAFFPQPAATAFIEQEILLTGALALHADGGIANAWLIYERTDSAVATKSLSFTAGSTCGAGSEAGSCPGDPATLLRLYGAFQVRVAGTVENEHVIVRHLSPAPSPDPRIVLIEADLARSADALGATIIPRTVVRAGDVVAVRAEVAHDGVLEELVFEQGALVGVGERRIVFTHQDGDRLYFAVALDE